MTDNYYEAVFSRIQQVNCTYELVAVVTACIRPSQAHARQTPSIEVKDGHEVSPLASDEC